SAFALANLWHDFDNDGDLDCFITYDNKSPEYFDNDGDGEINEDDPGGYDPNRNWPWLWQPEGIQYGAHDYPFSLPETRAVGEFVLAHPNIAAAQTYHNNGGMILRSPGSESARMERADDDLFAFIGERGESMLPGYHSYVLWKDLYQVWGGELDWFYGALGVVCFSNELWTEENLYRKDLGEGDEGRERRAAFLRYLLQNQGVVPWHEIDHPDYGKVEVGGTVKAFGRVPPSFLLEEELHRNMAFTLYHAEAMPLISIGEVEVSAVGNGLSRIRVGIDNSGIIPTRLHQDVRHEITAKNSVQLAGLRVLAAGEVPDPHRSDVRWQHGRPERLLVETLGGLSRTWVEFLVAGSGNARIRVDALRGGTAERTVSVP
ncbi:MAG: peptidase M14, partial [Candidatus Eisenbacteria bacterium]|nr:peptidase M14 [Candidatus Eisenbacteria bacterium]